MSQTCHRSCNCYKTHTFCTLFTRCTIPCACHEKPHLKRQKWSEHVVLSTCSLGNVLHATKAYTFSTSQLPKVVRDRQLFTRLTWKCASRHNDVHFFSISTSKSGPNLSLFTLLTWKCASRHNGVHFFSISTSKSGPKRHFLHFWLGNVLRATMACTFSTSQLPKVVQTWCVLYILTWKRASRHNGVHFFDISASKSGSNLVCFVHFDLETCFAPQWRALFRHLNFQKWSKPGVFCTFWLGNVLRATMACTFSTSQLPKVVQTWRVLYILAWKRASRHNGVHFFDIATSKILPKVLGTWGALYILTSKFASRHIGVQFFISHLASWLRTRRFSEPTFCPSWAKDYRQNTVNGDCPTVSRTCIFFLLTLSLLCSSHCFSICPYCRKFDF